MKKVHPGLRFGIVVVICILFFFALVEWAWFDGLLRSFALGAYLIAIAVGALCAGITYGVLPVKKTIDQSKDAYADKKYRRAVVGYWTWIFIWALFMCIWVFVRTYDL